MVAAWVAWAVWVTDAAEQLTDNPADDDMNRRQCDLHGVAISDAVSRQSTLFPGLLNRLAYNDHTSRQNFHKRGSRPIFAMRAFTSA